MSDPSPPLLVFSHPRSGTHFLGCALARNFAMPVAARPIDRSYFAKDQPVFATEGGSSDEVPWGSLVAHDHVHRFREHVPRTIGPRLYVWREPLAVLRSMYRWPLLRNHLAEVLATDEQLSWHTFLRQPLGWAESVHNPGGSFTPLEHWCYHVSGWMRGDDLCVRYENLVDHYDDALAVIGSHFDLDRLDAGSFRPVDERVGYNPGSRSGPVVGDDEETRLYVVSELQRLAPLYEAARTVLDDWGESWRADSGEFNLEHVAPRYEAEGLRMELDAVRARLERLRREARSAERAWEERLRNLRREREQYRQRYHRLGERFERSTAEAAGYRAAMQRFLGTLSHKLEG